MMQIQAGHLNRLFAKPQNAMTGAQNGQQGMQFGLANNASVSAAKTLKSAYGQSLELDIARNDNSISRTFAEEVARRVIPTSHGEEDDKDPSTLISSLEGLVDYLQERHGEETATAAMGMILGSTGAGANEDSLGSGLLNTIRFVDRNFGFAAGDNLISKINSGVNREMNSFFDNGLQEEFIALNPGETLEETLNTTLTTGLAKRQLLADAAANTEPSKDLPDATAELLASLKKDLDDYGQTKSLKEELDSKASDKMNTRMQAAMSAYANVESPEAQLLSVSV